MSTYRVTTYGIGGNGPIVDSQIIEGEGVADALLEPGMGWSVQPGPPNEAGKIWRYRIVRPSPEGYDFPDIIVTYAQAGTPGVWVMTTPDTTPGAVIGIIEEQV